MTWAGFRWTRGCAQCAGRQPAQFTGVTSTFGIYPALDLWDTEGAHSIPLHTPIRPDLQKISPAAECIHGRFFSTPLLTWPQDVTPKLDYKKLWWLRSINNITTVSWSQRSHWTRANHVCVCCWAGKSPWGAESTWVTLMCCPKSAELAAFAACRPNSFLEVI